MESVRSFWRSHGLLAAVLVIAALLMRGAMPGGYMISSTDGGTKVTLCASGTAAALDSEARATLGKLSAIVAQNKAHQEPAQAAAKSCAYGVLSLASLGGADIILLAAALAFVLALGLGEIAAPRVCPVRFLRPPLRAPPFPN